LYPVDVKAARRTRGASVGRMRRVDTAPPRGRFHDCQVGILLRRAAEPAGCGWARSSPARSRPTGPSNLS